MTKQTLLSYDDVLLEPKKSPVKSRSNVDTSSVLFQNHKLEVPIISAPMDTVTEDELAQAMVDNGGVGIIHRYVTDEEGEISISRQVEMVNNVDGFVGASVGISGEWEERVQALAYESDVDFVCVDTAHGHLEKALAVVETIDESYNLRLMAGNVATRRGVIDLAKAGADSVKIGVGPGSHCKTREVTGVGVPQFSAINRIEKPLLNFERQNNMKVTIVADGGIRSPGDMVKAIMAGADAVMIGGILGATEESPAEKVEHNGDEYFRVHGMASEEARDENNLKSDSAVEGVEQHTESNGTVDDVMSMFKKGFQSGLSYCGGRTIEEARSNAEFNRITQNTKDRNSPFVPDID